MSFARSIQDKEDMFCRFSLRATCIPGWFLAEDVAPKGLSAPPAGPRLQDDAVCAWCRAAAWAASDVVGGVDR